MDMHQGGCHPLKVGTEDHAAAGLCGCEPLSLAAGVSPLARARRGAEGSARLGASCYAGREWEGGLEKNRVKDGEGMWEGTSEGEGRGQAPGSTGGVKLLFPLQTPTPRHPSCRSHRAAGSTCHLHSALPLVLMLTYSHSGDIGETHLMAHQRQHFIVSKSFSQRIMTSFQFSGTTSYISTTWVDTLKMLSALKPC